MSFTLTYCLLQAAPVLFASKQACMHAGENLVDAINEGVVTEIREQGEQYSST